MNRLGSLLIFYFLIPQFAYANIEISEIMYDLSGSDAKREWIEIYNSGTGPVDIANWRFHDGTNHKIVAPPEKGGQGSTIVGAKEYLLLVSDAVTFLSEHRIQQSVVDTVMSLNNTTDTISLYDEEGSLVDSVQYSNEMGASGDGNSLQYLNNTWRAGTPTIGLANTHIALEVVEVVDIEETTDTSDVEVDTFEPDPYLNPDIRAEAGSDQKVVTGGRLTFRGEAFGSKNEPLVNARFIWNIGNREVKEGQSVSYVFTYPGRFPVTLTIASGKKTVTDRLYVTVDPAVIEFIAANEYGVTLQNKESSEINISGWMLRYDKQLFVFYDETYLLPKEETIFSTEAIGFIIPQSELVEFLYPNGSVVTSFVRPQNVVAEEKVEEIVQEQQQEVIVAAPIIVKKEKKVETPIPLVLPQDQATEKEEVVFKEVMSTSTAIANVSASELSKNSLYRWLLMLVGLLSVASLAIVSRLSSSRDESEVSVQNIHIE